VHEEQSILQQSRHLLTASELAAAAVEAVEREEPVLDREDDLLLDDLLQISHVSVICCSSAYNYNKIIIFNNQSANQ